MGNFYVNFSVQADDPRPIASILERAGRKAVVTPAFGGFVVAYEEQSDTQDTGAVAQVGSLLSREAHAPVLGVLNHDDDIFCYWLFEDGRLSDHYNSCPDYFGEPDPEEAEAVGDAQRLCEALAAPAAIDQVESLLHGENFVFAVERHALLATALGLPDCSVGLGYQYIGRGELPDGMRPDQLIHVGKS